MKFYILFCLIIFVFVSHLAAQDKTSEWTRFSSSNGEISFEMPSSKPVYFYDKDGFSYSASYGTNYNYGEMQMIQAAFEDTYFCVEIYKSASPKSHLDELAEKSYLLMSKVDSEEKNFTVKRGQLSPKHPRVKKFIDRVNFESRYIASKNYLYVLTVWNRGKSNPNAERFISSIKLSSDTKNDKTISISTLKPLTIDNIGAEISKEAADRLVEKTDFEFKNPDELTILLIPFIGFTDEARKKQVNGMIEMMLSYSSDGRIEKISLIKGLPAGLTRNAVFTALRTKFLPKISNGKAVSTNRIFKYSFSN